MPDRNALEKLIGDWSGTSRLWLSPEDEGRECGTTARVALICQGQFLSIGYTWSFEGAAQDGLILFGLEGGAEPGESIWLDSWHMARQIMMCERAEHPENGVILRGSYAAPPGPDWGWRVEIEPRGRSEFTIRMFNIAPEGQEALAVQSDYRRSSAPD